MPKPLDGVQLVFISQIPRKREFSNLGYESPVCFVLPPFPQGRFWFFQDAPQKLILRVPNEDYKILIQGENVLQFALEGESVGSCVELWGEGTYWRLIPHFFPTVSFTTN